MPAYERTEPDGRSTRLAAEIRRRLGPAPELSEWPPVSVVVLNRNGVDHLRRLLPGLVERTDYPDLELVLVDNGSSDGSLEYVRAFEAPFAVTILANSGNESFSDANNRGAELASGRLLLFLNNDVQPFESGWLRELVCCLLGSAGGAVGATLLQPDADREPASGSGYVIQQRGLTLRSDDDGRTLVAALRDHLADPLGETLGVDVEVPSVAGACLLIERARFDTIGGFTHGYLYGGEDLDLGLKLRETGSRVLCSGRSVLIHPARSIWRTAGEEQLQRWTRHNRRLFLERWGAKVRREYELDRLEGRGLWTD
jgi:GT2 family glycosyltransferase